MTVKQLIQVLEANRESSLQFRLPSGELVPDHFHVTEVGRLQRTFVDCGGTRRESVACLIQAWAAHDIDHRLEAGKLSKIFAIAAPVLASEELPVEVEYGAEVAAQYTVTDVEVAPQRLLFVLAGKKTDCLASDKCGVNPCNVAGCC